MPTRSGLQGAYMCPKMWQMEHRPSTFGSSRDELDGKKA